MKVALFLSASRTRSVRLSDDWFQSHGDGDGHGLSAPSDFSNVFLSF